MDIEQQFLANKKCITDLRVINRIFSKSND